MVTLTDPYLVTLQDERDNAQARNRDLERRVEAQAQDLDAATAVIMSLCESAQERHETAMATIHRLLTLIKDINEVYINMDEPGLMSWSERTAKRVEIVNNVNLLLAEMENGNAHR